MTNDRIKTTAFWVATVFGPTSFLIGGVLHLTQADQVAVTLQHLGYPAYFASLLGVWKLAGAIVITAPRLPRLKEWAYAGFFFDLTAAAFSRAAVGDGAGEIIAPLVFLALVLTSWALRPASRRLASASRPDALSTKIDVASPIREPAPAL
jgi:DoxX-like protein